MNQDHFELLKKVFPTSHVEWERFPAEDRKDDIVVDLLLRFSDCPFKAKSLRGEREVPGFLCVVDPSHDETEIAHNPNFGSVVIEAAGWLARFNARITVDEHNLEAYAKELNLVGEEMKLAEHAPIITLKPV